MKKITYIIILSIFSFSCSDDNHDLETEVDVSSVKTFEDYLEFSNADINNKILIQRVGGLNSSNSINTISTSSTIGAIDLEIDGVSFSGDNIYYGDELINWNNNIDDLSMFYGKQVNVNVKNKISQAKNDSNSEEIVSFYIPEIISANLYNLKEGHIQPGSYITWNTDSENVNGIILAVEYKPTSQFSQEMVENYNERLIKGLTIDDVGTYTITEADLAEFPDKANLTFYIGRTGYSIETGNEGENDVYIGAYTSMRADMKIDKE
ncbi:hypothetical protein [uncultured Winogradskyella sp.]|uniref:hypothetical protein n=1 Tax=uncultured Winogradskyella sp. TaxID=395353 RepID=UPI0030EE72B4|tara:strand:- start:473 stop:1267 length:795 start_codon:yes stop_codon:yes gene_type:complete